MNRNDEDYFVKRSVPQTEDEAKRTEKKNASPNTRRAVRLQPENKRINKDKKAFAKGSEDKISERPLPSAGAVASADASVRETPKKF
ncbi:MAG: hypothetical protein U0M06_09460, partial [Clostridia bacterium]|nr:hypothetical protein [Clostridia bacterium]